MSEEEVVAAEVDPMTEVKDAEVMAEEVTAESAVDA